MPEVREPLLDTPLLEKLERLTIHWQKSLPGLVGGHNTSRFAGGGQEFLDHRHFHQGDDLRAVNWRAYLRLEKLFLKMFQLEPRIPVRILVDISQSMDRRRIDGKGGKPALSKFDYAPQAGRGAVLRGSGAPGLHLPAAVRRTNWATRLRLGGGRHRFPAGGELLPALKPGGAYHIS